MRTNKILVAFTALVILSSAAMKGQPTLSDPLLLPGNMLLAPSAASAPLNFVSITATDRMFLPHPTWDGAQFWLVWLDHRADQYPRQQKGDISAMRLTADGAVIDSGGFAVAHTPIPEDFPTPAAIGRRVSISHLRPRKANRLWSPQRAATMGS